MHVLAYIPALIMLVLVMMPMGISGLATTELALTNKRIIGRMRKQRLTIPFTDVETVRVGRGILGLIFNYGSVTIIGNGIRVRFPGITKPQDMKALIDTAVENALFGGALGKPEEANVKPPPKTIISPPKKETKAVETESFFTPKNTEPTTQDAIYKDPESW